MEKKRTVLIIIIVSLLVLITTIIASLYFFTDIFKSNSQMFVSKLGQFMSSEETNLNSLQAYFVKKENTPYENNGTFSVNIQDSDFNDVTVPTIAFSGKSNKSQNQAEQNIEIQYSDDVKFPINYRQNGDMYGLQTEYVSQKYIAVENNNLKEFAEKLGVPDTSEIPDKIEFPKSNQLNFTEEEKAQLQKKYEPILQNITNDKVAISKTEKGKQYALTLTAQDFKNIMIQFSEILQNDNIILGKINSVSSENGEYAQELIENFKEEIQDLDIEGVQDKLEIIINEEKGQPNKIEFKLQSNSVVLEKFQTGDTISYKLTITASEDESDIDSDSEIDSTATEPSSGSILVEFTGLNSQEITEHYSIDLQGLSTYDFKNNISFTDNVEVEELNDETAMILNEYPQEQILKLMEALGKRIEEVNSDQMKKLGIDESENPLMYMLPGATMIYGADNSILTRGQNVTNKNNIENVKDTIEASLQECLSDYYNKKYVDHDDDLGSFLEFLNDNLKDTEASEFIDYIIITGTGDDEQGIIDLPDISTETGKHLGAILDNSGKIEWESVDDGKTLEDEQDTRKYVKYQ